jgi:deoxyribose-phosphate aldolase
MLCAKGASRLGPPRIRTSKDLAAIIDHTMLDPDASRDDIVRVCEEARRYGFATVCVRPSWIDLAARLLEGSGTVPIAVVAFPLGTASTDEKVSETRDVIGKGAREIDMVANLGALQAKDYRTVFDDIAAVVSAARSLPVKVILETGSLTLDEKIIGCALAKVAGAAYVKTSTGFGRGGATVEDVALLRRIAGEEMRVKASGGIRTAADAMKMVEAGADRIGASRSVAIVSGVADADISAKGY